MIDTIADSLNLAPINVTTSEIIDPVENQTIQDDYQYSRDNLRTIIDNGLESLNQISEIALASQGAGAYEVVSKLMKTLLDANKDLLELSKSKRMLLPSSGQGPQTINNNLMVGTTQELLKMIKLAALNAN